MAASLSTLLGIDDRADATGTTTTLISAITDGPEQIVVKLKRRRPRLRWAEDVVDNEDANRKKSKCCCVFHRPRELDESSGDEDEGAGRCSAEDSKGSSAGPSE